MTIEQQVLQELRELTPDKQKEVLNFVDSLQDKNGPPRKLRSLEGLLEDLNIDLTEEEITRLRRECWSSKSSF